MKHLLLPLLLTFITQTALADMSCKEYEARVSLKDSWITCRHADRLKSANSSSKLAEFTISPEINGQRYSTSYFLADGKERATDVENVLSADVSDSKIEIKSPTLKKISVRRLDFESSVFSFGAFQSKNKKFDMNCEFNTPVEFEDLQVGKTDESCALDSNGLRKCQPFKLWKSVREMTGLPEKAVYRTYYGPNADGQMECRVRSI